MIILFCFSFSLIAQQTLYVKKSAVGSNSGTSWEDAYTDLQMALQQAEAGDEIWVAAGTYYPTEDADRSQRFELPNGVKLYGGFTGVETSLDERDWEQNPTILSGDIGVPGDSTDNSYNIMYMMDVDTGTVVDGFYFIGGQADMISDIVASSGGAIHIDGSQGGFAYPKIRNCTFEHNVAYAGGAVVVNGSAEGSVAPQFHNCTFRFNKAYGTDGGAVFRYGGSWVEVPKDFWKCTFYKNEANRDGGAVYYKDTQRIDSLEFRRCEFNENVSGRFGGAISLTLARLENSFIVVDSNRFYSNLGSEGFNLHCWFIYTGDFSYKYFSIKNNLFKGDGSEATHGKTSVAFDTPSYSAMPNLVEVANNSIVDNHCYGIYGFVLVDSSKLIWRGDEFVNNVVRDISSIESNLITDQFSLIEVDGVKIINSSISPGSTHGFFIFSILSDFTMLKISNLFMHDSDQGLIINGAIVNAPDVYLSSSTIIGSSFNSTYSPETVNFNLKIRNSVLIGNSYNFYRNAPISNCLIDFPNCDSLPPGTVCGPNNFYGLDPLFRDTASGDYRLHPCSPARDAGDNGIVDSLGIQTDLAGAARIQGGTVDLGAWETAAFTIVADSILGAPCAGSQGSVWLNMASGCPPFFLAVGADTILSDSSRIQLTLPGGQHTLVVNDGRMDADTLSIEIPSGPPFSASLSSSDVECPGVGGTASILLQGGTAPYDYAWSTGDTTATVGGLAVGTHTVTVTDAQGCLLVDSVSVGAEGQLSLGISISPINCHDSADGVAAVSPQDGIGPYLWQWADGSTDSVRTGLSGGDYSVTVTDALGCSDALDFSLPAPDSLSAEASVLSLSCANGSNGSATATVTGGIGPYSYFWSNSSTQQSIDQVPPGWYSVTVTDLNGCQDTAGVQVGSSPALSLSILGATEVCSGDSALLLAQVAGGTAPYQYHWAGGSEDSTLHAGPGTYVLTLTDALGCTATASHSVSEASPIGVLWELHPVTNPDLPNGAVDIQVTFGGTPPYQYQWSHGPTTASVDSLSAGEYTLTVTDAQGCTEVFLFEVLVSASREAAGPPPGALIVPNPSGAAGAELQLSGPWPLHLRLSLHDSAGRQLWQRRVLRSAAIPLPQTSQTPPGTYWLLLRSEDGRLLKGLKWVRG